MIAKFSGVASNLARGVQLENFGLKALVYLVLSSLCLVVQMPHCTPLATLLAKLSQNYKNKVFETPDLFATVSDNHCFGNLFDFSSVTYYHISLQRLNAS